MSAFEIKLICRELTAYQFTGDEKQACKIWHVHISPAATQYNIKYRFAIIRGKNVVAVNRATFMLMPVVLLIDLL